MTLNEFYNLIKKSGIPFKYHHFEEKDKAEPPFGVYYSPSTENFMADGAVYIKSNKIIVELYTKKRDLAIEKKIEDIFDNAELYYTEESVYLDDEKLFMKIYNLEV